MNIDKLINYILQTKSDSVDSSASSGLTRQKSQSLPHLSSPGSSTSNDSKHWNANKQGAKLGGVYGKQQSSNNHEEDDDDNELLDGGSDAGQATSEQHSSIADQDEFGINGAANDYGDDTFEEDQEISNSVVSFDRDREEEQRPKLNVKTFSDFLEANKDDEAGPEPEEEEPEDEYSELHSEIEYDNDPPPKMKIMAFSGIVYSCIFLFAHSLRLTGA